MDAFDAGSVGAPVASSAREACAVDFELDAFEVEAFGACLISSEAEAGAFEACSADLAPEAFGASAAGAFGVCAAGFMTGVF
ncbi:hypothetical protein HMI49_11110 [Corallococcus exercitus]|uniref:Uncharacterized protein n=1 Tax=Corallococcus exercitus TaxID=2316736 RepID=A0A7Y4KHG4_9BACT|nr:hypothetical protein [Corallococcus exercitus]